jgi:hypothetical protein
VAAELANFGPAARQAVSNPPSHGSRNIGFPLT